MLYVEWDMDKALEVSALEACDNTNVKNALRMLQEGLDVAVISRCTDLSEDAVNALYPVVHGGPIDDRKINSLTGVSIDTVMRFMQS